MKQQSGVDMLFHSDGLFWFRYNQSLLLLFDAVCWEEKQYVQIILFWFEQTEAPNLRSATLKASTEKNHLDHGHNKHK